MLLWLYKLILNPINFLTVSTGRCDLTLPAYKFSNQYGSDGWTTTATPDSPRDRSFRMRLATGDYEETAGRRRDGAGGGHGSGNGCASLGFTRRYYRP
jgi:hypothetical protein